MINTYENFENALNGKIREGIDLYQEIIENIIKYPHRYSGVFRLSNAKTKILQNITQSREIKLGDFMEHIYTEYFSYCNYENLNKNIGVDESGNRLNVDQLFTDGENLYLIEQKIRDDHDSTKKRGQFNNFVKKIDLVKRLFPNKKLHAAMFFIDPSLKKNRNFYINSIENIKNNYENTVIKIYYGKPLFVEFINNPEIWDETVEYLKQWKNIYSKDIIIPNFDEDHLVFEAMKNININLLRKLTSDVEIYTLIRDELFPTRKNLKRLKQYFIDNNDIRANLFTKIT